MLREKKVSYRAEQKEAEVIEKKEAVEEKLDLRDAIVEWRKKVTFERLMEKQNFQPITYDRIQVIAGAIEWEHSLEELLVNLD